jgi:FkbM family methyltransferase
MLKRIRKLFYKLGLLTPYQGIDRMRYLRRLRKADPNDWRYAAPEDIPQFANEEVVVRWEGIPVPVLFYCRPDNLLEADIIKHGAFRPAILEILGWYAQADTLVLDIGANVGAYAIALAKMHPKIEVHCFEPNPEMAARLERNIRLNGTQANVCLHTAAASDALGRATFHVVPCGEGNPGLSALNMGALGNTRSRPIEVNTVTLDSVFLGQSRKVSGIKIDVQGSELEVLNGARGLLERDRPAVIFEHEDVLNSNAAVVLARKHALSALFTELDYEVLYVSRRGTDLFSRVAWDCSLNGDLLAIPLGLPARRV